MCVGVGVSVEEPVLVLRNALRLAVLRPSISCKEKGIFHEKVKYLQHSSNEAVLTVITTGFKGCSVASSRHANFTAPYSMGFDILQ